MGTGRDAGASGTSMGMATARQRGLYVQVWTKPVKKYGHLDMTVTRELEFILSNKAFVSLITKCSDDYNFHMYHKSVTARSTLNLKLENMN